jgi:hypothetical protein
LDHLEDSPEEPYVQLAAFQSGDAGGRQHDAKSASVSQDRRLFLPVENVDVRTLTIKKATFVAGSYVDILRSYFALSRKQSHLVCGHENR